MLFLAILSTLLTLNTVVTALTFTSPFPGTFVDLTSPFSVTWIPSSTDPSTFTLEIINTEQGSSAAPQTLATNVQTSKGSYTIPANMIDNYGAGFELWATNSSNLPIGRTGTFILAQGWYSLLTSNGVLTIVGTPTQQAGAAASSSVASIASASATTTVSSAQSSAESTEAKTKTSETRPSTRSSTIVVSTSTLQSTSSSNPSSSSATATKSGSSDSNGNLGFDSAADIITGSVSISCAAFLAVLIVFVV